MLDTICLSKMEKEENMVVVRNACKKYGKNEILVGMNMTVPKGTIYALLGSSGCGKTTIINCIIQQLGLDDGTIQREWNKEADIGYMPQETALHPYLTIHETFQYFGAIYKVDKKIFDEKVDQLIQLFELPDCSKITNILSGGQKRRVSFALTLLHEPKLLILDEPTVGLDPLLRHCIWEYLVNVVNTKKTTVIATTHYIEEARQANIVAIMRKGTLIAEEPPEVLMSRHGLSSLEDTFLYLCEHEASRTVRQAAAEKPITGVNATSMEKSTSPSNVFFKKSRFLAELKKNVLLLWRNKPMLAFQLLLPMIMSLCWGISLGNEPHGLKIGVVNDEIIPLSMDECDHKPIRNCTETKMSCSYIHSLTSSFEVLEYGDIESSKEAVKDGRIWAVLHFPSNFSTSLVERLALPPFNSEDLIESSQISVWMDSTDFIITRIIRSRLGNSLLDLVQDIFHLCEFPSNMRLLPIVFNDPVYGDKEGHFSYSLAGGFLVIMIFYLGANYSSVTFVEERVSSILKRASIAGVKLIEIFTAHLAIQMNLLVLQTILIWIFAIIVFKVTVVGYTLIPLSIIFFQGIVGAMFGYLCGLVLHDGRVVTFVILGTFSSLTYIGGCIWPDESLHPILYAFRWLYPTSYASEAVRMAMLKAWTIGNYTVMRGYISSFSWIIVLLLCIFTVTKYKNGLLT